jgi:hypothetical protein
MRNKSSLGIVVVAALLASCGGSSDSGGGGGGGGGSLTLDQALPLVADVYCSMMTQCMGTILDIYNRGVDCKSQLINTIGDQTFAAIKEGVKKQTVVVHEDKLQGCIDAFKAEGCAMLTSRSPKACTDAIEGKVASGGECTFNSECAGDAYCKADTACPGKCSSREAAGSACTTDDACVSGLMCHNTKCEQPVGNGAPCEGTAAGCEPNLMCVGAKTPPGTCKSSSDVFAGASGATCDLAKMQLCQSGLACAVDSIQGSTAVLKCVPPVAAGAACKLSAPDMCPMDQYCSGADINTLKIDGACAVLPGAGAACASVLIGNGCAPGLICDASKICKKVQNIGGACASDAECWSNNCDNSACAPGDACPKTP